MRTLAAAFVLALLCLPADGAVARVTGQIVYASTGGATTVTCTLPSGTTAGNLLVFGYYADAGTPTFGFTGGSPTSSAATTVTSPIISGIRYVANVGAGITAVTITASFGLMNCFAAEYSGVLTASPLDKVATADSGFAPSNPMSSGATATLAATDDLAVGMIVQWRNVNASSVTATGAWTVFGTQQNSTSALVGMAAMDIAGTGSTTGVAATGNITTTANNQAQSFVATFKAAGGAAAPPPVRRTLIL